MSPKQKIAPNCNIFAIRDRREFPRSQIKVRKRSKMAILRLFSLCGSEGESPIAKKLQKARYFCFCDWLIVAMGQTPPRMNRIRTEIRACTCRATKNRPKVISFSNIWLGQQDSRALRALSPLAQAPAGKSLKRAAGTFSLRDFTSSVRTLCIRQGNKKPPEGGFVLKYMAGPAGFEPT